MIRVAVVGALGRMGRSVIEVAQSDSRFYLCAALVRSKRASPDSANLSETLDVPCDVLIDFTVRGGTRPWLQRCVELKLPLVIGATGHDDGTNAAIRAAAELIPIVKASNFSTGVALLRKLAALAAEYLGANDYDVEIVETHHRHKRDAPSGTALTLIEAVQGGRGAAADALLGRRQEGERKSGQIGVHAVRMGEIVGQHEIHFSGHGETITLRHEAHSRETFARGALNAAAWVIGKPPGLYSMQDVLFSPDPA